MSWKPMVVGNWKMELSHKAAIALAKAMKTQLESQAAEADVVVCPSYPSLAAVKEIMDGSSVMVGAQDIHHEEKGAFTGSVSVLQISQFATWSIVGHSERRAALRERDEAVVEKANLLLRHGLQPIICVGETLEEKERDETVSKITAQAELLFSSLSRTALLKSVIAYEPIWAIGSGFTPQPDEVAEIILLMRKMAAARFDSQLAERLTILYGGSVKSDNVKNYVGGPYANGVLVGGASVHTGQFVDIVKQVASAF